MILVNVDDRLYRGSEPKTLDDFERIKAYGITTIISLQGDLIERLSATIATEMNASMARIEYVPMSAVFPPSEEQILLAAKMVIYATGKTLVHCKQGRDRTGFFVAAYRMLFLRERYESAVKDMDANGFHAWYFWWKPFLKKYCGTRLR